MNDKELQQVYAWILARAPADRGLCVVPADLLALAEGRVAEVERLRSLRHIAGCGACRHELDLLRSVMAAGRRLERPRLPLALAASVALLIAGAAVWRGVLGPNRGTEVSRSGLAQLALVAPVGDLHGATPRVLVWRAVPAPARYRVELLDAGGNLLFSTVTSDTVASLPESLSLLPGADYRWWVLATRADATEARSLAERFRIQP